MRRPCPLELDLAVAAALLAATQLGCQKKAEPRPKGDVCADIAHIPDCAAIPEGATEEGFSPAFNCYDVGRQQFNCGEFDSAVTSLQRSAALQPEAKTWHALGEAFYAQEKWGPARDAFQKAVDADPKKRDSWLRLGQTSSMVNQTDAAHQAFAKAAVLDPTKSDALTLDAEMLSQAGKLDEAMAQLQKAEKLTDPAHLSALFQKEAQVLELKQRRAKKAKDDEALVAASSDLAGVLKRAGAISPSDAEIQRQLAEADLNAGEMDDAEHALDKATQLDPKDFVSPRLSAILKEKRGAAAEARAAVAASLKVQPKQTVPYLVLGRLDLAAGKTDDAEIDFRKALGNLDGKDPVEIEQLADLGEKVGHGEQAEQLYTTLESDPEQSTHLEFWLAEARLAQLNKHADKVKAACAKAKALVANAECPPPTGH